MSAAISTDWPLIVFALCVVYIIWTISSMVNSKSVSPLERRIALLESKMDEIKKETSRESQIARDTSLSHSIVEQVTQDRKRVPPPQVRVAHNATPRLG